MASSTSTETSRLTRNEEFVKKLLKAKKVEAIKILKAATEEEYKCVFELLINAENTLEKSQLKKFNFSLLKKAIKELKNISKKGLVKVFSTFFKDAILILGAMLLRMFEQGVFKVYGIY